jgi:hypothetical protein
LAALVGVEQHSQGREGISRGIVRFLDIVALPWNAAGARFSWEGAMGMNGNRLRVRCWNGGALQAATIIALAAVCGASSADEVTASAPGRAVLAQTTSDDPCRYLTAQEMGKAFGRPMQSSKLANICQYRGTGTGMVVLKVEAGTEGAILRSAKSASAQGQKQVEKVSTAVGEAYFDSTFPVFIGRVGNREVQIETTIQPMPREAMIAVGTRIMETLSRQ